MGQRQILIRWLSWYYDPVIYLVLKSLIFNQMMMMMTIILKIVKCCLQSFRWFQAQSNWIFSIWFRLQRLQKSANWRCYLEWAARPKSLHPTLFFPRSLFEAGGPVSMSRMENMCSLYACIPQHSAVLYISSSIYFPIHL